MPSAGPVLVVAPPKVPNSWTGDETFKRTVQLVDALSQAGWTVIAPWEYQMLELGRSEDLLRTSTAQVVAERMGIAASRLWLLEAHISEASATQETVVDHRNDAPLTAHQITRQHLVDLTVYDPRLERTLGRVSAAIDQDPFVPDAVEVDALPNLSANMDEIIVGLTRAMLEQQAAPADDVVVADVKVFHNPRALERYAQRGQASLYDRYGAYGELEVLARAVVHYQFFDPTIDIGTIEALQALPPGLRVLEPGELAGAGVRAGDYLVEGDGIPLDGRHALDRFLREGDDQAQLVLLRGEERVTLTLPAR